MRISDWSSDVCSSDLPHRSGLRYRPGLSGRAFDGRGTLAEHRQMARPLVCLSLALLDGDPDRFRVLRAGVVRHRLYDRGRSALRSEEHTSELRSLMRISYAVFC